VSHCGAFRLHSGQIFLSQALNGEDVGLEEVQDRVWNILYYDTLLGRFDERRLLPAPRPSAETVSYVPGRSVRDVPGCSPSQPKSAPAWHGQILASSEVEYMIARH
jgi:hypothetical protein